VLALVLALLPLSAVPGRAAAAPPAPVAGEVRDIDSLLRAFSRMPGLYAEFREEKHLALLAQPLVNEGTLHFARGMLARHTTKPTRSSLVVAQGRLSFGDEGGAEHIDLASNPVVKTFVDSFVQILAGDRSALEALYAMEFADVADGWKLTLRPRVAPLQKTIDRLELSGRGLVLTDLRVVEKNGDETQTQFSRVDTARRYSKTEIEQTFRVPTME
jgi:hypothetical protein